MASKKIAAVFAAQILALTFTAPAIAAGPTSGPTAADKDTARALMAQGAELRDKNDLKGALQSFQAADAIMHVPSTSLEVAKTEAALGELVEARDAALAAARYPLKPGEPKPFIEARKDAQTLSDDLEPRIPSLQITVKNAPSGATPKVDVDGVNIPAAALAFPRKVNPGHHVVTAVAGDAHTQSEVDVKEREIKGVVLDLPTVAPPPPPPVALTNTPPEQQKSIEPDHPKKNFPVISIIGFGVGVAGVAVGSVTGILSLSKTSSLKDQCPNNQCPASVYDSSSFQSDKSSASTMGTISTIAFIVGGAGVVVGVVGLFLPQGHASAHATTGDTMKPAKTGWISPWLAPAAGGGAAGLVGAF
jgi:hypothetical protein